MTERNGTAPASPADQARLALDCCPHLRAVDGPWHSATPSRAHRCALLAEGRPTLDRQRLHCLGMTHVECPTWLETYGSRGRAARPGPFVSTAPVVLEGPGITLPTESAGRRLAAPVTVVVVGAELGALVLSRGPLAPSAPGTADPGRSPVTTASAAASSGPTAAATARPTAAPTTRPEPTPSAAPTVRPTTYRVRSGDTLTAIAARFGTTAKVLATLNRIANPSLIHVGQVLTLP